MSDRTYLVTGANTGIGKETARALARQGGRVVLACRSEEKTKPVIDELARSTGNDRLSFLPLDLADLASVRDAADRFLASGDELHVLVDNAGVGGGKGRTKQGFEVHFGINHLGHFLLTTLLLDRLRQSAAAAEPSRVVVVSSDSHYQPKGIDFDRLHDEPGVAGVREYGVSKLCNVLFAQELARRVPADEVVNVSLHPGVIASDIWRRVPGPARWVMTRFMKSPAEGAATSVHGATAPDVLQNNGAFYSDCRPKEPSKYATPELAKELWARSEEWTRPYLPGGM
jgi:NAD(P)-dependent dehydrogenase (short-subunit alcohol dehydrogenase family)